LEKITSHSHQKFTIRLPDGSVHPIAKKRMILGSGNACDILIKNEFISTIHAIIELEPNYLSVYDMNSTNGTFYKGDKLIYAQVKNGESFFLANTELKLNKVDIEDLPPPILERNVLPEVAPSVSKSHRSLSMQGEYSTKDSYPLNIDKEFSEYIFEEEQLYPIFNYTVSTAAVEVIISFNDRILSVDYLPFKNAEYFIKGKSEKDVELAYLPRKSKHALISIAGHSVNYNPIEGKSVQLIGQKQAKQEQGSYLLGNDDILVERFGNISIYVRITEAPPSVKIPPFFRIDKDFRKYLFLVMLFIFLNIGVFGLFPVDEEKLEEKNPDRIATILYQKPAVTKAIAKTEDQNKEIIQKAPTQKTAEKSAEPMEQSQEEVKKEAPKVEAVGEKTEVTERPKKAEPKAAKTEVIKEKVTPPVKTSKPAGKGQPTPTSNLSAKSPTKGPVQAFKSLDFSSSINSLLAKGGGIAKSASVQGVETSLESAGAGDYSPGGTVKKAQLTDNVGTLTGYTDGKVDSTRGLTGVVSKKTIYTAGIPAKTVVLGGMDPDTIRKILLDHLPQFRYCYQKVLDKMNQEVSGRVDLNFIIGASGHVTRASVPNSTVPDDVKVCVVDVLKGIPFPEPRGGGQVEVNQPMNFYPESN
jgi:pSer/pThr/pTyr-binding forkhead associated (FHA) protein